MVKRRRETQEMGRDAMKLDETTDGEGKALIGEVEDTRTEAAEDSPSTRALR